MLGAGERERNIASDLNDFSWMDQVDGSEGAIILLPWASSATAGLPGHLPSAGPGPQGHGQGLRPRHGHAHREGPVLARQSARDSGSARYLAPAPMYLRPLTS